MACIAEQTCGNTRVTRYCDDIPQCTGSMADPCCDWTLSWKYKIVNNCATPAEVTSFETTLCHGHCHGGMAPFGECLEESEPQCDTRNLANSLMPSGQMIGAGEIKVARVEAWTTIDLSGMDGAKIYGNSTVLIKTSDGSTRTGEASQCIDLCGKALMSRAGGTGGATNEAVPVIVDSMIIDEKILEQKEGGKEVSDSLAPEPTMHPTTAHPTLISMTTFNIVDGTVVGPTPPAVATESDSKEGEPHPYVWLAPTNEPIITFSPTSAPMTPRPTLSPSTVPVSAIPTSAPVTPGPTPSPSTLPVSAILTSAPVTPGPTPSPSTQPISDAPATPDPTSSPSTLPVSVIPTSTPTIGSANVPTDILAVMAGPRSEPAPCKVSVSSLSSVHSLLFLFC